MIPIAYFLIPYGAFLILFLFFALVDLFHLIGFGRATGMVGFLATFIFLAGTVFALNASYNYIMAIDWTYTIDVISWIPSLNSPAF